MTMRTLQMAWHMYSGKHDEAVSDLLQRLRDYPAPAVQNQVTEMLGDRRAGK